MARRMNAVIRTDATSESILNSKNNKERELLTNAENREYYEDVCRSSYTAENIVKEQRDIDDSKDDCSSNFALVDAFCTSVVDRFGARH